MVARERQRALSCRGKPGRVQQHAQSGGVSSRFGEGGGQVDRRRARRVLNPCARESKARSGRFLRDKLISDHSLFFSYEDQQGAKRFLGDFPESTGLWTAGCWLRRLHQLKDSTAMDLGTTVSHISA